MRANAKHALMAAARAAKNGGNEMRRQIQLACVLLAMGGVGTAGAADRTIRAEGKFGDIQSKTTASPGGAAKVELAQQVRRDRLSSSDPEFDGATLTAFEQMASFPDRGDYEIYGVIETNAGDHLYLVFNGSWTNVVKDGQYVESPFAAKGNILGGTGKLADLKGAVQHQGTYTPAEGGRYRLELVASD